MDLADVVSRTNTVLSSRDDMRSEFTVPQNASRHILSAGTTRSIDDQFGSELGSGVLSEVTSPRLGAVKNLA